MKFLEMIESSITSSAKLSAVATAGRVQVRLHNNNNNYKNAEQAIANNVFNNVTH